MASPAPAPSPVAELCQSAADLGLIVGFLRDTSPAEDGWVPVLVGTIAALSEARRLAGLVEATYRPPIEDLMTSLQGLRAAIDEFRDQETLGAGIAVIGQAITALGEAMDALAITLTARCPAEAPAASATP